jgi:hypothetical protein
LPAVEDVQFMNTIIFAGQREAQAKVMREPVEDGYRAPHMARNNSMCGHNSVSISTIGRADCSQFFHNSVSFTNRSPFAYAPDQTSGPPFRIQSGIVGDGDQRLLALGEGQRTEQKRQRQLVPVLVR